MKNLYILKILLLLLLCCQHDLYAFKLPAFQSSRAKVSQLISHHKSCLSLAAVCCVIVCLWKNKKSDNHQPAQPDSGPHASDNDTVIIPGASYIAIVDTKKETVQCYIGNVAYTYDRDSSVYTNCLLSAPSSSQFILIFNREDQIIETLTPTDEFNFEDAALLIQPYLDPYSKPQAFSLDLVERARDFEIRLLSKTGKCIFKNNYFIEHPKSADGKGHIAINLEEIIPYCDIMITKVSIHVPNHSQEDHE